MHIALNVEEEKIYTKLTHSKDYSVKIMTITWAGKDWEVAKLEESYQDLEAQFNIASALLDMDGQELDDPLHHVGDWTQNQAKSIEKNKAWNKMATIHILVLAQ
ncbi:hypothetical protein V6N12_007482 [Hibiscus sabdariffa]|uniref:Uncharacterized protein n=1 Tax=Hibiscus sabdariffa TaxID=183260 RepID=A0ABR2F1X3_9ROSI